MDGPAHTAFAHRGLGGGGGDPLEESPSAAREEADAMYARRGCCCCFWAPRLGSGRPAPGGGAWERIGEGEGAPAEAEGPWWRRALMKVREWSEIVAGPRWKTFIRRFNRNHKGGGAARAGMFQYDPLSYALNFDEGQGQDGDSDGDHSYRNFSARYVLPPSLARGSVDLGGRDAPPLFAAA